MTEIAGIGAGVDVFPRHGSKGSGSTPGYTVEVRKQYGVPEEIDGVIIHKEWQTLCVKAASEHAIQNHGLFSYTEAEMIRWSFHNKHKFSHGLETRIVKHVLYHNYNIVIEGAHNHIGGENRSDVLPDWNTK